MTILCFGLASSLVCSPSRLVNWFRDAAPARVICCPLGGRKAPPAIAGPWSPGAAQVHQLSKPLLTSNSTCNCTWAGTVSIEAPASDVDVE